MRIRIVIAALLSIAGCRTPPLSSDTLYDRPTAPAGNPGIDAADTASPPGSPDGPSAPPDVNPTIDAVVPFDAIPVDAAPTDSASADTADIAPDPTCPEEPPLAGPPPICEPDRREAGFSGGVVDACEPNRTLNANVSIGGQRRCSGAGKGAFDFQLLQTGCKLTLVAARPGYQRYCRVLTAPRAGYTIALQRLGGCTAPFPGPTACTCTEPGCMPHTGD